MKPEIRRLHSPDVPSLSSYQPAERDNFGFLLQVMIGPKGGDGEESFDVIVCSPRWILEKYTREDVLLGRHHILMIEWDFDRLVKALHGFCDPLNGATWEELAGKLGRFGKWEFEDYVEQQ